jgi:sporulation protein YlmC with PRC-barrel domain
MNIESGTMMRLSDSDQVLDRAGNEIGKVDDLLIDTEHKRVRMLRVEHGGLLGIGTTPLFIPVEAVERITDDEVGIERSRGEVADAPRYEPELVDADTYFTDLYGYYRYMPYWAPGYLPQRGGSSADERPWTAGSHRRSTRLGAAP